MSNEEKVTFYHRFVEALKFGYANRAKLSDDLFVPGLEEVRSDEFDGDLSGRTMLMCLVGERSTVCEPF